MPWNLHPAKPGEGPRMHPKQFCDCCGKPLAPVFKAARTAEDWFWTECGRCDEPVCKSCSDENEDGTRICLTCLLNWAIVEHAQSEKSKRREKGPP